MDYIKIFYENTQIMLIISGIIGIIIGSFLNVIIYRLPLMMEKSMLLRSTEFLQKKTRAYKRKVFNLIRPSSHCPSCKQMIGFYCNIPIISFLILRGKCKKCGVKISWRYPLVELLSGCAAFFTVYTFGLNLQALVAAIFSWILIALIFIDIETQLLPDDLTIHLLWLGLLVSALGFFVKPENAIIGAITGYLSLWLLAKTFELVRGISGMGYGDFKLFAALGAWLGWHILPLVLLTASLSAAVISIAFVLLKKIKFKQPISFGPYLAISGWLAFFWGQDVLRIISGYRIAL